jgi:hypothetical protein
VRILVYKKQVPLYTEPALSKREKEYLVVGVFSSILAVSLIFGLVIQSGILIFPGNKAILAPFLGADDSEILHIGGTELIFKVDIQNSSADAEEHPVLIGGIQVEIHILEIPVCAEGGNTVNLIMRCVGYVKTDTASDSFQNDTMIAAIIGISHLETAEFNLNCFSYLQSKSPF